MNKQEDLFIAKCCKKEIGIDEAILNHGMCNECMDVRVKESNKRQLGQ